jgi:cell division protein FtsI/penicillin-binding protein 2
VETLIPGYVVGGKTGTAQIWDSKLGEWMPHIYNHTFVGFVGAERPEAVILVRIHQAEPSGHGVNQYKLRLTSNELFRRVATDTIDVLDIPPLPADAPQQTAEPSVGTPAPGLPEIEATAPPMAAGH